MSLRLRAILAKKCQQTIDYGVNLNIYHNNNINTTTNKYNNNKLFCNNQYQLGCGKRGNVEKSCENSSNVDVPDGHVVVVKERNTYLMQQANSATFVVDCMVGKSAATEAAAFGSDNEDNAVIAALYNKTHGGAFYHFTATNNDNQPYVEDI